MMTSRQMPKAFHTFFIPDTPLFLLVPDKTEHRLKAVLGLPAFGVGEESVLRQAVCSFISVKIFVLHSVLGQPVRKVLHDLGEAVVRSRCQEAPRVVRGNVPCGAETVRLRLVPQKNTVLQVCAGQYFDGQPF